MKPKTNRPHWSYSSISQYLKCPLQFYYERVLHLPRRTISDAQVLGSSIHAALAHYHRSLQVGQTTPPHQIHEAFLSDWAERLNQSVVVHDTRSPEETIDLGIALIDAYLLEPVPQQITAVEAPILTPITNSRGEVLEKPLLVVIDLITRPEDGQPVITELKTTSRSFSESEIATSLQPTFYASAFHELTDQEPLVQYVALVKTKTPKVQRIETVRTVADFGRLGDVVRVVEQAVEAEIFYPVENPLNCASCTYFKECRTWTGVKTGQLGDAGIPLDEEAILCSSN